MDVKSDTEKFKEYYQKKRVTGTYDSQREGSEYRKRKRALELKYFLELINKKDREKVLELGCSSGFLTKHLGEVTAIDTSEDMLEIASRKNSKAKCIPGDMFELRFKPESFDKVVTMRVWNHLQEKDLRRALRQVNKVLKKQGNLIFDAEEKNFVRRIVAYLYQRLFKITGYTIYQYSLPELKRILGQEGFRIEKIRFLRHRIGRQIIMRTKKID
jgi:ubiquinone/menaquinone biosynthesis C-methylase UbiE